MKFAAASKSELIEEYIVREILPRYRGGQKIPSELELSRELQTSRPTIHKIFSNLTAKGVLYRENGVGTFVTAPSLSSRNIAIVLPSASYMMPENDNSWFNQQFILEGFTRCTVREGVNTNLFFMHPDDQSDQRGLELLLGLHTEFYLFPVLSGYRRLIAALQERGKFCVARASQTETEFHTVYGDLRAGVRHAVDHLIRSGRRRIAHFGGHPTYSFEADRYQGYLDAMREHDLPVDPALVRRCDGSPQDAYQEARRMFDAGLRPDAIFAGTDLRAFGIMDLLREKGLRIPADIAIIGSDNLPDGKKANPPLSTVEYPLHQMGEGMFEIFRDLVANPTAATIHRGYECRFIQRESC